MRSILGFETIGMYLRLPRNLHLELSSYCNAECPMCVRTGTTFLPEQLSYYIIESKFCKQNFKQIKYGGNLGDPLMNPDAMKFFNLFRSARQVIHTNGSLRSKSFWKELGQIENLCVVFGIDGTDQETHSKYRVDTFYERILENAQTFIDAGGEAWWQFIVFRHNEHQIENARSIAKEMKFKWFETLYTRRFSIGQYEGLEPPDTQPLMIIEETQIECKAQRREEMYISADGRIWACDYTANHLETPLNIYDHDFEEAVSNIYFDELLINPKPVCKINCGMKYRNQHRIEEL